MFHLIVLWFLLGLGAPVAAQVVANDRAGIVAGLCGGGSAMVGAVDAVIEGLAETPATELEWLAGVVTALHTRSLRCSDAGATLTSDAGTVDAVTGEPVAAATGRPLILNLRSRGSVENLSAALTLLTDPAASARAEAISLLSRRPSVIPPTVYARAAERVDTDEQRAAIMELAQVSALTAEDMDERLAAIAGIVEHPNRRSLLLLEGLREDPAYASDERFRVAVDAAVADTARWVKIGNTLSTLYNGLSYASILFIAAVGLAIIFGLMGVINLAQGEFIMLGAYSAFVVQETLRSLAPGLVDWYLLIAIPFVFLITAALGVLVEIAIVRHLYRRPLMTLLATWAVSLFLINLVRVTFGTQNLQILTPSYVSGGFTLVGDFIVTYNRLFAIVFAGAVLAITALVLKGTALGLNIRTVSQNRDMAGCIGIPTRRVDMLAFGFGSGLAGLAGLALAPIYNVNPLMGTNFIIESFMVVVLGGVGTLMGTVIAALGIGQINVLIEPIYGAVAAKVIVLLLIIAFIQWRPEGLFPAPGRRK
ncbi:urea ABC transporter permease subunit UrtB [Aurantimonas aggregata]|uniref:Urea ABC transporter permease subunit UrtB n=2 Tax=Aurantimonas aggregata TaxID=2047720 RepID=A0A6L9MJD2_9HYPH|nr:urea ABC transporter permease subunit UrtB [Aurantimonas aggregata]